MAAQIWTDRQAQAAKCGPDGQRIDYIVRGEKGLRLRVTQAGTKIWSLLYTRKADGKKLRLSLGEYPTITLSAACAEAGRLRNQARCGDDPVSSRREAEAAMTVGQLANLWLTRYAEANRKRVDEPRRIIRKDIGPILGDLKADAITKRDVIRCADAVLDRGAAVMANRTLGLISTILAWGVAEDLIDKNPAASVRKRAPESSRSRRLSDDELRTFWTGIDQISLTPEVRDVLKLCLLLGQRVNEIGQANKDEFKLAEGIWEIPPSRVKNGTAHRLPLPDEARRILENAFRRSHNSAWAFPSPAKDDDKPMTDKAVSRAWRRKRGILGLDVRVHDLRRTFASMAGDIGFDDYDIGLVLNHQSGRSAVTAIYNRAKYDPKKRTLLEAVERAVQRIVSGETADNVVEFRGMV